MWTYSRRPCLLAASQEIRDLVLRLAGKLGLKYRWVHGEMTRLGHQISKATVRWILCGY